MCSKTYLAPPPASQSLAKTEISAEKCEIRGSSFEYEISGFQSAWEPGQCRAETVQMSTWLPVLWMRLKIEFAISCWGFCNMTLSHTTQHSSQPRLWLLLNRPRLLNTVQWIKSPSDLFTSSPRLLRLIQLGTLDSHVDPIFRDERTN